ncbi:ABC transporter ATP-binding protein [Mesobacterium sp. TK19101]|uniref:ABC transporter ATP-binding protein n=1 Tax=Mesobacterium hydrothermale TaxID=3111907 RepID=A0ABU6HKW7_9RHOB|nr:ABC transporter ATP-binding protein [Mesobacterium sp. TK19101]MEC3863102.1 ABC transporter ATP-binding protein [Mesobacterium sp. TK19101]
MTHAAIQTSGLSQRFGDFDAVRDVNLTVNSGEIFGFLGHNGAGKTTTIHMLTTLAQPTSGTARVAGHDIVRDPLKVRREIGYVPENVRLYDTLTTRENLNFFAQLSGLEDVADRVTEVLEFLSIEDLSDRRVGTFSKGMRQRVGLAQAILHRPSVLFLDEPSSGLDPMGMKMLRDLIVRLNAEWDMTIFMNTHLISEIAKTCTSIGVLNHGRLVFNDTMEKVTERFGDDSSLEELYLSVVPDSASGEAA